MTRKAVNVTIQISLEFNVLYIKKHFTIFRKKRDEL